MDEKDARSGECSKILPLSQLRSNIRCITNKGAVRYKGQKHCVVVGLRDGARNEVGCGGFDVEGHHYVHVTNDCGCHECHDTHITGTSTLVDS